MSYKNIPELLKEGSQEKLAVEIQSRDVSDVSVVELGNKEPVKSHVKFISDSDELYKRGCRVESVENAVRVEQGEFAVLKKTTSAPLIGTHHVTPCVVICTTSNNYFGMAHFDSYRTPGSLEEFFKKFKNDGTIKLQIFGGKAGSDPLRSGTENKKVVLDYIHSNLSDVDLTITNSELSSINLVFEKDGTVQQEKFAVGINVDNELGALMRLRHNIGGMVTAQQCRLGNFMPLNFIEAYQGGEQSIFLDRLALKALKEFDPTPIAGEEQGWSTDPGGYVLTKEMRLAHPIILHEINTQKLYMESQLNDVIGDPVLRKKLIELSPIYIGPEAEIENLKTLKILENLCVGEESSEVVVSQALLLFNKASPYPLITDLAPVIENAYQLKKDSLIKALNKQFGNINNLAYGVDIVAPDIVKIINEFRHTANPGLVLTQALKDNTVETNMLLRSLSQFYKIDEQQLLDNVTDKFNKAITEDKNVDKIIRALDQKNEISKDSVLQVLKNHYNCNSVKMRFIEKKFDSFWDDAIDPKGALEEIIHKIPPETEFDGAKEYNDLVKAFHSAHLEPREALELRKMSFDDNQPGIKGVMSKILKEAIVAVMSRDSTFAKDYTQTEVACGELTRAIRDSIPYQKETTVELEMNANEMLRMQ